MAASLLQYDQQIQIFCLVFFCFHLFDNHSSFQAAEQGSDMVVKQVRVTFQLFFFAHFAHFCLPGSFQAEFCFSRSFPLSKQVELQNGSNIVLPNFFFQAGAFFCFISSGFEKEPLTIAKTRLAFIGCYYQLVEL